MQYYGIVYTSEATAYFNETALLSLLQESRHEHAKAAITGLLLYSEGQFMQVLEGPTDPLREYFGRIAADPRHGKLQLLANGPKPEREFHDWHMAFQASLPAVCDQQPNYLPPTQLLASTVANPVHPLLQEFLLQPYAPLH